MLGPHAVPHHLAISKLPRPSGLCFEGGTKPSLRVTTYLVVDTL